MASGVASCAQVCETESQYRQFRVGMDLKDLLAQHFYSIDAVTVAQKIEIVHPSPRAGHHIRALHFQSRNLDAVSLCPSAMKVFLPSFFFFWNVRGHSLGTI
jgi:hypothetical protein